MKSAGACGLGFILAGNGWKFPFATQIRLPIETKQIAAGLSHNVILGKDGNVYTFGKNQYHQGSGVLGVDTTDFYVPQKVKLPGNEGTIINVCAGYNHTVLHSDTGKTFAFGDNTMGQLGFGGYGYARDSPMKVEPPCCCCEKRMSNNLMHGSLLTSSKELKMLIFNCITLIFCKYYLQ